jgi:glycosyltransferase involved in cell wall biosynthesis
MKPPYHIAHIVDSLGLGGAERMLVDFANNLNSRDYRVSVWVTRSDVTLGGDLRPGIPLHILGRTKRFDWRGMRRLARLAQIEGVDVFHAHSLSTYALLLLARTLGLLSTPVILHDQNGWIEVDQRIPLWFRWWGSRRLAHYIGVCAEMLPWAAAAGVPRQRISIIENTLDFARFADSHPSLCRQDLGAAGQGLLGVVVSNIRSQKGIDRLIEAVGRCQKLGQARFLLVGAVHDPAYWRECRERMEALGMADRFIFTGPRQDVLELLRLADFAVLASISESGPLVLVEYLAVGLPVVYSRTGAIGRQMDRLGLPGAVEPGDVDALAYALDELCGLSPAERTRRGRAGQDLAHEYFDIHTSLPKLYRVYASVLEQPGR